MTRTRFTEVEVADSVAGVGTASIKAEVPIDPDLPPAEVTIDVAVPTRGKRSVSVCACASAPLPPGANALKACALMLEELAARLWADLELAPDLAPLLKE